MNRDGYGEIINGLETYSEIAEKLKEGKSIIIGWTDEECTHLDILFTGGAYKQEGNYLQCGLRNDDLFISVMRYGSFGFYTNDDEISAGYLGEKLNLSGQPTLDKLAELINSVKRVILNRR